MTYLLRPVALGLSVGLYAASFAATAADPAAGQLARSVQQSCSARTLGPYGFQCQGFATVKPGGTLEPFTSIGTVAGSASGLFDGHATANSSLGSSRLHLVGQAVFKDKTCFGHIQYTQFAETPGGDFDIQVPLDIDFAMVDGGFEILGTAVGINGAQGDLVPRMSCRLVKIGNGD